MTARPLLRLAAEGDFPSTGDNWDNGQVEEYSAGAFSADLLPRQPVAVVGGRAAASAPGPVGSAPCAGRRTHRSRRSAPRRSCSARTAWRTSAFRGRRTGSRLPVEPGARYTKAPTLILDGEFDANVGPRGGRRRQLSERNARPLQGREPHAARVERVRPRAAARVHPDPQGRRHVAAPPSRCSTTRAWPRSRAAWRIRRPLGRVAATAPTCA